MHVSSSPLAHHLNFLLDHRAGTGHPPHLGIQTQTYTGMLYTKTSSYIVKTALTRNIKSTNFH